MKSHEGFGLLASLLVAVIVGAVTYDAKTNSFAAPHFWVTTFATLFGVFLLEQYATDKLWTPLFPTSPPVATDISMADNMAMATHNVCAISSNWLGFWLTESYLYYLHLNTAKSLQSSTKQANSYIERLSDDTTLCSDFYDRGFALAKGIASRDPQARFFSLRLLVYSAADYYLNEAKVMNLISAQALGGVHCIPLVTDELRTRVNEQDWNTLTNVTRGLCHQTFRLKVGPRSRAAKLRDWITGKADKAQLVPDILIINNNDVIPKADAHSDSEVWWYDEYRKSAASSDRRNDLENAKEVFRILCGHAQDCRWQRYTARSIRRVPLIPNPITRGQSSAP